MVSRFDFAPLHGITTPVFYRIWNSRFGGADRLFLPFFSPTDQHLLTPKERRFLDRSQLPDAVVIPQVMTRRADDLVWAAEAAAELGYTEVNLNLGCPSGTVTGKGKGAGMLSDPAELDRFFDAACSRLCLPLSVKTRIGVHSPEEFPALVGVFNRYPLASLMIHARTAKEKYKGPLHPDAFALALSQSRNPVSCNGDLWTVEAVRALEARFPSADSVLLGRGALSDPALFRKLRGGPPASREELRTFTAALYREYQSFYGQAGPAAHRMREVWFYLIHLFDDNKRHNKALRRFRGPAEYEAAEAAVFRDLPLRTDSAGELF